jgi:hypothetical protein
VNGHRVIGDSRRKDKTMALEHVRSFKELRVYQKTKAVSQAAFKLSQQFPKK